MRFGTLFLLEFTKRFLLLASGLALVGTSFYLLQSVRHENLRRSEAVSMVSVERQILLESIHNTVSDVRFLSTVFRDHDAEMVPGTPSPPGLIQLLSDFMTTRPQYHQIRYLHHSGQERVRMNMLPQGPQAVSPLKQQNKSDRGYFQSALKLRPGDAYVSRFDLNVESGVVERPFRPTLRICTQVLLPNAEPGLVIINLDGTRLLNTLRNTRRWDGIQILMVNAQGFWIVGPQPRMEWGNILSEREGYTLAARLPELWLHVSQQDEGVYIDASGLYAFTKLRLNGDKTAERNLIDDEYWTLLAHVPQKALQPAWKTSFLILSLVVLLFIALASALLTRSFLHRMRTEQSLQETEEKVQAISHSSHDALIMVDERGHIVFWNPSAEHVLGYKAEEVMNLPAAAYLDCDASSSDPCGPALKAGPFSNLSSGPPITFRRKNGTTFPAEVALSSFRLHGCWWTVNAVRDITKRAQALQELEKSREMLVEALHISRMGGFSIALASGEVFWTDELGQLLGVEGNYPPSITGMAQFVEPSHRTLFLNAMSDARKGNPVDLEMPLRTAKGRLIWVRMNIRALFLGDKVHRLSGIYQDVSDRKKERIRMEQLSTAVEHSPASVLITNHAGIVEYVNPKFTEVCGYSPEEILGHTTHRLHSDASDPTIYDKISDALTARGQWSGEISCRTKDGRIIWQQLSISSIKDEEGTIHHLVGIMEDVTERRRALEALQASERQIRAMSEATLDAMVVADDQGRIVYWNPSATRIFGYLESEAIGCDIHALVTSPEENIPSPEDLLQFAENGHGTVVGITRELQARRKTGETFPCEITVSSFALDTRWFAVGTIRDITQRKEYERQLRTLATTDELTNLLNRRAFLELAESELDRAKRYRRPFCLLMLDLDRFKMVNDTYGHDAGDKVLMEVSRAASSALRETDTLGRLGGEEFAAILPETTSESAREVADRLRKAVSAATIQEPSAPEGRLGVTISVGIAGYHEDRNSVESILRAADKALYRAKELGRNRTEIA
ncbi:MAG: PAS domain S-box protein [Desulfovibrio sp.]